MNNNDVLISVENLKKYFPAARKLFQREKSYVHAVDDVSFSICRGETMGLVGESGCGKTTVGRTIIRLYRPTAGKIVFDGQDITDMDKKEFGDYRRRMQMIFQDPYSCLDPRMYVRDIIGEGLEAYARPTKIITEEYIRNLCADMGFYPGEIITYSNIHSVMVAAKMGFGVALLDDGMFIPKELHLQSFKTDSKIEWALAWRDDSMKKSLKELVSLILELCEEES